MNLKRPPLRGPFFVPGEAVQSTIIYLDESGDLGWTFTAPYMAGGSSRFLTISALCAPTEKSHIPKRVIRSLYQKFGWSPKTEKKWANMDVDERKTFAREAQKMCAEHSDIYLHAIVVKKQNVWPHVRQDSNKLYNYMIKLCLLDLMAKCDVVTFIPDPRSIKVQSGNSLHDYLQTELWFAKKASTTLITAPVDSKACLGLQFADMLAGLVQSRFERNYFGAFQLAQSKIRLNRLFF